MKKIIPALMLAAGVISGCATNQRQLTRNEWESSTRRTYQASADTIQAAAERIFRLADGDDFKFYPSDNGFIATRSWSFYLVFAAGFGTDQWNIDILPYTSSTTVKIFVASQSSPIVPTPTTSPNVYSATVIPGPSTSVPGNAVYSLFWRRMDWMLGITKDWPTCSGSDVRVQIKQEWGPNDPLCNSLNVKDTTPTEADRIIPYKPGSGTPYENRSNGTSRFI